MTYAEFFYEIKNKFMGTDVSDIHEHLAFQFDVEDPECGGIFYVEVKEGQLYVEPYEYYDRDAKFIADADTFMKLAEGKIDPIAAFTIQKLKVDGNIDKALRLKEIIDLKKKQEKKEKKTKKTTKKTETDNQ
ncbi:MAG: SCP2 sterol-binding domain-containing protein [Lachnospiraceae bacterium]